jgi:PKD repeat protein
MAVFNADSISGSAPLTVNFDSSQSFDPDGEIVAYAWDFDDGVTSSEPNPSVTYSYPGNFIATLVVTDDNGATASQSIPITVTDTDGGCISNCMSVDRVTLRYKLKSSRVKGLVWLVDENNSGVRDAVVHATWTLPDGSVIDQYSNIGTRLRAAFSLKAEIDGTYVLTIIDVNKPGYSFDPDNSNVLNGAIDITP